LRERLARQAIIAFHEIAERQISSMSTRSLVLLDRHLSALAMDPTVGVQQRPSSPVRQYVRDGVRIAYVTTALATIILVAYVEVD
jgi:hypothetical protein